VKYTPHSYQEYATKWIVEKEKSGLLMDMGLGKTVCTLTAIDELIHDYFDVIKVLVIAPLRVAEDTWTVEAEKWDHLKRLKISKVLGTEKDRIAALNNKAALYVINRENVVWLVKYFGKEWPFDMVVIDELSSFKSPKSQRFKALRKVKPKRVVGLTGTPAPNGLMDLWPEIYLLDQGERLGRTLTAYRDKYFTPDKRNQTVIFSYKPKEGAEEIIYKNLSDICVSMKAEDYLELPEKIENVIPVKLPKDVEDKYKKFERELLLPLKDSDIVANNAAVLTNKLLQFANGAIYDENNKAIEIHDRKLKALEEIIEAVSGKPVLIFYSYKHDRDRIKEYFKNAKELKSSEDIKKWNKGEIEILLVHPASAGHGLNLQAGGNIVVWFGLTWSLELYQQANARLHRQGQKQNVIIHHIIAKGTVDEDVMKAIENKNIRQEELLQAVKVRVKMNEE